MKKMTGAELRVIIEQLGIQQEGVAEILGTHPRTIWKWIQKDEVPQAEAMLLRILHAAKGIKARGSLITTALGDRYELGASPAD